MSIGEVLGLLRADFPEVTISKIRFLEEQGLVEPERTPSGYRKFTAQDVERLRFILSRQRDHYLPLRVIREYLEAVDAGEEPAPLPGGRAGMPRLVDDGSPIPTAERYPRQGRDLRMTRAELVEISGADEALLTALEAHGLVAVRGGSGFFDGEAAVVARIAAQLGAYGIEPRHLRAFRAAADREAGLVEQVVRPMQRQPGPEASARAEEAGREVAALCLRLHAALVTSAMERGGF